MLSFYFKKLESFPSTFNTTISLNFFPHRSYDALVGVVTHDYFDDLSDAEARSGVGTEQRNRMLQTFVRNQYSAHLQEILLTLQNEYTDWAADRQTPRVNRKQVNRKERHLLSIIAIVVLLSGRKLCA